MSNGEAFSKNPQFATTHWNIVKAVGGEDEVAAKSALEKLCRTYWYPIYTFVRFQGHNADEAADLTQAFFADLLERENLKAVDPKFGKFRSFLLAAAKNFIANHWKRAKAIKRGGQVVISSFDLSNADSRYRETNADIDPASKEKTPDQLFERQWAETLLQQVNERLRIEFESRGKAHQFQRLEIFLAGKSDEATQQQVADELGMTEVAIKVAVHRMRRRFGEILREEIGHTLENPVEIDLEISHLFEVLQS